MSFSYTVRESFSGFSRTKLSSAISIITIMISLILLGIFGVASISAGKFIDHLRNRVELEVFLQEPLTVDSISSIHIGILRIQGVDSVTFISKDDAARIFCEQFGDTVYNVLDFNPLPPSFRITLLPAYRTASRALQISEALQAIGGVESVKYRRELLELIDRRAQAFNNFTLGLGVMISLSAILLVSNTIRLAIYAKRKIIRTMELVGATRMFIRLPFLLEGMLQGCIGGAIASGILYAILVYGMRWVSPELTEYLVVEPGYYLLVVFAGVLLGLVGSLISVARFIRPD
jgi:cell division transport system permease protein